MKNLRVAHVLIFCLGCLASKAGDVPIGTTLEIRLEKATGTRISKQGDRVEATLIAPVMDGNRVVMSAGSTVSGEVSLAKKLGWGIRRSTAALEYRFHTLELPDGRALAVQTRLVRVETARENVDADGRVAGIRATTNVSSTLATYAWRLSLIEPPMAIPVWLSKFAFARAPDPEIHFPAGTEMVLKLTAPVPFEMNSPGAATPGLGTNTLADARRWVDALPQQRAVQPSGKPSDILNVMVIGSKEQMELAFEAAGWTGAQRRSLWTVFLSYQALVERRPYEQAPMSNMSFSGRPPDTAFQKGLNTFAKRHHIRVWKNPAAEGPEPVWVATATEDTGIGFSWKKMHFVHEIDPKIDNERAKVVNDLIFTGCVDSATLVERELPYADSKRTDGRVAVLRLNDCQSPRRAPDREAPKHGFKALAAAFGDDIIRSNFLFIGAQTTKLVTATKSLFTNPPKPLPRSSEVVAQQQSLAPTATNTTLDEELDQ
jgi:hypothetical protein